ncbi:MAG TPA: caspase family protein [Bryobacteraceae bacterium]|nr:caspase family protein [Bryobacteraceae bacterium]
MILGFLAALAPAQQRGITLEQPVLQAHNLRALVIGNAKYTASPLANPANDARALSAVLTEIGFGVETATDLDYKKLGITVDRFVKRLGRGDIALFFYAGHGMQIEGENYLVPVDFDAKDEAEAKYSAYPLARILEGMERADSILNLVILDACRNNPFRTSRAAGGGLAPMGTAAGTFVAFATSPGRTASDNSQAANGLFTAYLLESLKTPGLTLDEVFNRTRLQVFRASKEAQRPWSQSSVIGTFYFRPVVPSMTAPAPRPDPPAPGASDFQEGLRESRIGDPDKAAGAFTRAVQKNPSNADAYYERAMNYVARDQFAKAIDDFSRVLQLRAGDINARIGRAASLISLGEYRRALPDLDEVIRMEPDNAVALFDRAIALENLNENARALETYSQVVNRRPKWPGVWYNRGRVQFSLKDFAGAIADFSEAIHLDPRYANAYLNRGIAYASKNDLAAGLKDLNQAVRLEPERADFYSNRAGVRRALGDNAGAAADEKKARELGAK